MNRPAMGNAKIGACAIGRAIEFIQWMDVQRTPVTWLRIADRFNVSRATAHRWLAIYRDARIRPERGILK